MVYLCPVDWRWIKQRPQFLAEELNAEYDVQVVYPFSKRRKGLQKKTSTRVSLTPYITLPSFGGRLPFLKSVNRALSILQMKAVLARVKPEIIWLSFPDQIDMVPEGFKGCVIYDCMDDHAALNQRDENRLSIVQKEKKLLERADLVFASSENLIRKICLHDPALKERIVLLRNGYNSAWEKCQQEQTVSTEKDDTYRVGYIGTVGRWFDFELLKKSLQEDVHVVYHLYGPVEQGVQIPQDERIVWHGVVEHDAICRIAQDLDALMMPFMLNDIVRSVDPVKLYEYIYLNKNIICVRYPEIERFSPFVFFYESEREYMKQLHIMMGQIEPVYNACAAKCFLKENDWASRAAAAHAAICKMQSRRDKV